MPHAADSLHTSLSEQRLWWIPLSVKRAGLIIIIIFLNMLISLILAPKQHVCWKIKEKLD